MVGDRLLKVAVKFYNDKSCLEMPLHDLLFFIRKLNCTFAFVLAKVYLYKVKASACLAKINEMAVSNIRILFLEI